MIDAKDHDSSEVATLELLDSPTLDLQTLPVVCGGGADPHDTDRTAWFNPGYRLNWFSGTYWRGSHRHAAADADESAGDDYRLPLTWGSPSKH